MTAAYKIAHMLDLCVENQQEWHTSTLLLLPALSPPHIAQQSLDGGQPAIRLGFCTAFPCCRLHQLLHTTPGLL